MTNINLSQQFCVFQVIFATEPPELGLKQFCYSLPVGTTVDKINKQQCRTLIGWGEVQNDNKQVEIQS
jgi:hypothetical protein